MANEDFDIQGVNPGQYRQDFSYNINDDRNKLAKQKERDGSVEEKGFSDRFEQAQQVNPDFNVTISEQAKTINTLEKINNQSTRDFEQKKLQNQEFSSARNRSFINETTSAQQFVENVQQEQIQRQEEAQTDIAQKNQEAFSSPELQEEIGYQQSILDERRNQASRITQRYQLNSKLESNQPTAQNQLSQLNFDTASQNFNQQSTGLSNSVTQNNLTNTDTIGAGPEQPNRSAEDNTIAQQTAGDETSLLRQRADREDRFAPPPTRDTPEEVQQVEEEVIQQSENRQEVTEVDNEQADQGYLQRLRQESDEIISKYNEGNPFQ